MTNLTKKADSDNDSILDGIDCLSVTTVRTPEMSASIISVIEEQQDINADDDIIIGYLRTIIGYRSSIHSYQQQNFLKAYTAIMSGEVIRIPNRTYRSFNVESLEVRVKHHNSKLKNIKPDIKNTAPKQDIPATRLFKVLNPELFMKPNRWIMGGGVVAMAGIILWLGSGELKHRREQALIASTQSSEEKPRTLTYQEQMAERKRSS
ncbi:hypothetical protein DL89DRAFT_325533 [Linderina pennispora]|uniref:Uncharacterized protein n=1 Tax=Linderina pennispora TaxID=61395 RepID=A0A1Y1VWE0_9FUNG|nr:uncharacterized protein DL89DRAFT_325533 [Linderina pennispora]ORX65600.1 hypothetical protein DL89DRAFT_325533 [Linderina pennispora]